MRGDLVFLDFPYGDGEGSKVRPAIVVQDDDIDSINVIVALVTSQTHRVGPTRLLVDPTLPSGWGSGLRFPSVVSCENLYSPHRNRIICVIGRLPDATMLEVETCLKAALGLR